jgi:putative transposase
VSPIKELIEKEPSFGYRTVANLLLMNKNRVQRMFQLKGWQVKRRALGHRPRVQALPSVARHPKERWATDLCRVWGGRDGWLSLALVGLPYPGITGSAPIPEREGDDGRSSA